MNRISVKEFADHLGRTRHYFKIMLPGTITAEMQDKEHVENQHGDFVSYLKKIARSNNLKELSISTMVKNGSSTLKKAFFIVDTDAVVGAPTTPTTAPTTTPTVPTIPVTPTPNTSSSMDTLTAIENAKLSIELQFTKKRAEELEEKNKSLERKVDTLHEDNVKLVRENGITKDKSDLEIEKAKVEALSKKSEGLSGVIDEVTKIPKEGWQFLAGMFPDHPMNKMLNAPASGTTEQLNGSEKHENSDAQAFIELINENLVTLTPENISMITMLIDAFKKKPELLLKIYTTVYPQTKEEPKA